jgi:hypothetical protein
MLDEKYPLLHQPASDNEPNLLADTVEEAIFRLRQYRLSRWRPLSVPTLCYFDDYRRLIAVLAHNHPLAQKSEAEQEAAWRENIQELYRRRYNLRDRLRAWWQQ